jgi:hypothetical protein
MPVVLISHAPSRALYERVAAEAHVGDERPAGLIIHTASEMPDGSVRIVDIWESQAQVEEFERARLAPALAAIGAPSGPPERDMTEPFHVIR